MALFHDEKMVGKFNQQETMYLLMLLAMNENTDYTINIPITNENQATGSNTAYQQSQK